MKTCTKCRRELSLDRFAIGRRYKGGLRTWCKDCTKLYMHERYKQFTPDESEKLKLSSRRWREENPLRAKLCEYKGRSKYVGTEYSIPDRLFEDLVTDNCFYCHSEPKPFNGIDRVDNARGYVEDNVVTCCEMCNLAKRDCTRQQFEAWAIRVADVVRMVA